jgi:hypothetical protein
VCERERKREKIIVHEHLHAFLRENGVLDMCV